MSPERKALYAGADLLKDSSILSLWHKELLEEVQNIADTSVSNSLGIISTKLAPRQLFNSGTMNEGEYTYYWNASRQGAVSLGNSGTYKVTTGVIQNTLLHNKTGMVARANEFKLTAVAMNSVSTLSIDVDNAAYSNIRSQLMNKKLPVAKEVRIEELINYFDYDYPQPKGKHPFSIMTEIGPAPWNTNHHLVRLGIQGKKLVKSEMKDSNLVFLIDVSGSMNDENKLPLLKESFQLLLNKLTKKDKVSIVVYANASGVVLDAISASNKKAIRVALNQLEAGGSTAGRRNSDGIQNCRKKLYQGRK